MTEDRVTGTLRLALIVGAAVLAQSSDGVEPDDESLSIELFIEEQPLESAVAQLATLTQTPIEVVGDTRRKLVNATVNAETPADALDQLLAGQDHVIIWGSDDTVTIMLIRHRGFAEHHPSESVSAQAVATQPSFLESEAYPPDEAGYVNEIPPLNWTTPSQDLDPPDNDILPPDGDAKVGWDDLGLDVRDRVELNPEEDEILPPDPGRDRGHTVADLKRALHRASRERQATPVSQDDDLLPPDNL